MASLSGKVALVTGAARGMGAATARLLAAEGARVVLADVEDATALADEIGGRFRRLDVTSEADWQAAVDSCSTIEGRLDILVNNAGILRRAPLTETSREMFDLVVAVNQTGPFLGMKIAAPLMARQGGSIVNVSSTAGLRGAPGHAAYVASKFALRGMTKVAAIEFAPLGIRVNSVHPGLIETPMIDPYVAEGTAASVSRQLIDRVGNPAEVAAMILFLASDASSYSTGAEFLCDGGLMTGVR
jgi:3alpha(or 20beta)-hydroxysteroid dehydrogenase